MRLTIFLFVTAVFVSLAQDVEVEEEDLEEPYNNEYFNTETYPNDRRRIIYEEEDEPYDRRKREIYDEDVEHVIVKRTCAPCREKRSLEYTRRPRQVHQYEVHEYTDDGFGPSLPPYEDMLAASADHYPRIYAVPGSPDSARYLEPAVSGPIPSGVYRPVSVRQTPYGSVQYVVPPVQFAPITTNPPGMVPVNNIPVNSPLIQHVPVPSSASLTETVPESDHVVLSNSVSALSSVPGSSAVLQPVVSGTAPLQFGSPAQLSEDLASAAGHHSQNTHAFSHHKGGGHKNHAHHNGGNSGKNVKGFKHDHYVDKGGKGHKTTELHKKQFEEAEGKKKKHHDHADHKGDHEEEAHGQKGSKFEEKKGHKKGHKTKGYHNKYHKDEFHKEHKFYDDFHKSGEHHRYGRFNAKHAANESGKKKAHQVDAGHDYIERGKKGHSNKGHMDAAHRGHKAKHGHEEHSHHHAEHGHKGGKEGGSHWGYQKQG